MTATEFDTPAPSQEEINWAILAHVGALAAALVSAGTLGWLVPLLLMSTKGETSSFVLRHAKAALNFQVTWVIAALGISFLTCGVGSIIVYPLALILALVGGITGGMRANEGEFYRYPLTYQIVK